MVLVVLSSFLLVNAMNTFAQDPVADITKELICACGCGKITYDCYCDLAKEWKEQITKDVTAGKTKNEIIASFVETYGDSVIATPKKSGLELTIWTLPVIAVVSGTAVIYNYARKKAPISDLDIDTKILEPEYKSKKKDHMNQIEYYERLFQKELKKQKEKK